MDIIETIQSWDWTPIVAVALQLVGAFALIATQTANRSDTAIADFLLRAINFLGANANRSRNDPSA